jgi:hypothetical protein
MHYQDEPGADDQIAAAPGQVSMTDDEQRRPRLQIEDAESTTESLEKEEHDKYSYSDTPDTRASPALELRSHRLDDLGELEFSDEDEESMASAWSAGQRDYLGLELENEEEEEADEEDLLP